MRIKLLKPVNFRKVGTVLDVADGVAELWILQKKAERVRERETVEAMVPAKPLAVDMHQGKRRRTA